ncbi:TPA: [acyl-carrier-protein] S-malonyltransferase [Candidatus Poribacteria bacterium]|nr:[acyl-carrier-protein] S-malonyltransferase [Candidatus Poribacteria bacterium]
MIKVGAIFAGQGAQYAGMGLKLINYKAGKETFKEANDVLNMDIEKLCCEGTDEELADTAVTQPAIVTCSIALFRIFQSEAVNITEFGSFNSFDISATAGLSVGEYSALVVSGALTFADALRLVKERGKLMAEAGKINPGTMLAIMGLDDATIKSICEEASSLGIVQPANYNCPGQIVISGQKDAVQKAQELAQKAGAKRCIPLDVSGAFHSPLMRPAEDGLRNALKEISFSKPSIPFIANVTGDYLYDPDEIKEMLALQLTNPIQWEKCVLKMVNDGIETFIEFGPGKVLSGLVRRICQKAKVFNMEGTIGSDQ